MIRRLASLAGLFAIILMAAVSGHDLISSTAVQAEGPDVRSGGQAWTASDGESQYVSNELVVRFRPSVPPQAIENLNRSQGASTVSVGARSGLHRIRLPQGADVDAALAAYQSRPEVAAVARNTVVRAFGGPNDTFYSLQWHLDNPTWGGIHWQQVWERADRPTGTGIPVAVIDTGIAYNNPYATDLQGQQFLILSGSDVFNNDDIPSDDHGHGTHVAGTVAQATNNALGVAGVASGATLVPIKVLDNTGAGTEVEVIEGIYLAIGATAPCEYTEVPPPARVINMSLGWPLGTTLSQLPGLADALECAATRGVVTVAAAGNDGSGTEVAYPAAYPTVIAVGATTIDNEYTWYSNAGVDIDLVAPGGEDCSGSNWILCLILGIDPDKNGDGYADAVLQETFQLGSNPNVAANWAYYFLSGTSMASPHVAATAALVWGVNPSLSGAEVRSILENTADGLGDIGWPYGHGLVNAAAAVAAAAPSGNQAPIAVGGSYGTSEDVATTVTLSGSDAETCDLTFAIVSGPNHGSLSPITMANNDCTPGSPNSDTASVTYTPAANFNGADSFTYRANDGATYSNTAIVTITVTAVNDPPVAKNDAYTTRRGQTLKRSARQGVLANDTDVDGNPLTAVLVTTASKGTLILKSDGSFTYTPNPGFIGTDSFNYKANDGTADSTPATVTITVRR